MPAHKKYTNSAQRQAAYRLRCKRRCEPSLIAPASGAAYHRWEKMRKQALGLLNVVIDEMEIYYDQRSETWQDSQRAEAFLETKESLEEISETLAGISMHLSEA